MTATTELAIPVLSLPARLARLYAGLAAYGVGMGLQIESTLGNDPWNTFHQGLSVRTGWSVGTWLVIVGALVMLVWIPLRQKPGLGTISNVVLLGVFTDATIWLVPAPDHLAVRWAYLLVAVVLAAAATGLYISAGLGPGPRDGVMTGLHRLGLSIRMARTLIEATVLSAGFPLEKPVRLITALGS
ncbi:hypothetical protein [Acrocarpospora sp. B8E8]|uniref:YczE/YyaS/YitT family protein n=1 Tax=Acrocarpospora sp. B8E8 TaxID=3153572 RepID=UPI00325CC036